MSRLPNAQTPSATFTHTLAAVAMVPSSQPLDIWALWQQIYFQRAGISLLPIIFPGEPKVWVPDSLLCIMNQEASAEMFKLICHDVNPRKQKRFNISADAAYPSCKELCLLSVNLQSPLQAQSLGLQGRRLSGDRRFTDNLGFRQNKRCRGICRKPQVAAYMMT